MSEKTRFYILLALLLASITLLWYAYTLANNVAVG